MEKIDQVTKAIATRQNELLDLLSAMVAFPTVSPPARNAAQAQEWMANQLARLGFVVDKWDVFPHDPNVVGLLKGTDSDAYKSLIINGHMDVAEVGDDREWNGSPFQMAEKDGRVYGRGVADMKGGLAANLFAIKLLKEYGITLKGDLIFQSVVGEEAGEAGTKQCVERGYKADFAVVADSSDLHIQGQGGVITGWITLASPETFHDGMRSRMIHAGGGVFGANAIEKMAKVIQSLQELERHWAVTKSYPGFPPGVNTINPAVIEGGRHAAFIADRCALWITVHFYPDEHYQSVAREVEEHILRMAQADPWLRQYPPTFTWGGSSMIEERGEIFPPLALEENHPGTRLLAQTHQREIGVRPAIGMSLSVTDGGWLGDAGIPTVIYGPGDLKNAHAVNESVPVDALVRTAQVMARFIAGWCNTPKS